MVSSATRIAIDKARSGKVAIIWEAWPLVYDSLHIDATLKESHSLGIDLTSHPIEDGAEISDHTIQKPFELTLEGVLSNTPIQALAALRNPFRRAHGMFEKILSLQAEGALATIFTGLNYYEDMMLMNWSVDRTSSQSDSIWVNLAFKQVFQVESQLTEAPIPTVERAKPRKSSGRKAKTVASTSKQSLVLFLGQLIGAIK